MATNLSVRDAVAATPISRSTCADPTGISLLIEALTPEVLFAGHREQLPTFHPLANVRRWIVVVSQTLVFRYHPLLLRFGEPMFLLLAMGRHQEALLAMAFKPPMRSSGQKGSGSYSDRSQLFIGPAETAAQILETHRTRASDALPTSMFPLIQPALVVDEVLASVTPYGEYGGCKLLFMIAEKLEAAGFLIFAQSVYSEMERIAKHVAAHRFVVLSLAKRAHIKASQTKTTEALDLYLRALTEASHSESESIGLLANVLVSMVASGFGLQATEYSNRFIRHHPKEQLELLSSLVARGDLSDADALLHQMDPEAPEESFAPSAGKVTVRQEDSRNAFYQGSLELARVYSERNQRVDFERYLPPPSAKSKLLFSLETLWWVDFARSLRKAGRTAEALQILHRLDISDIVVLEEMTCITAVQYASGGAKKSVFEQSWNGETIKLFLKRNDVFSALELVRSIANLEGSKLLLLDIALVVARETKVLLLPTAVAGTHVEVRAAA